MQATFLKPNEHFLRRDPMTVAFWAIVPVGLLTAFGVVAEKTHIVAAFYASPYVGVVCCVAFRVCIRAGMIAAALSTLSFNYFFADGPGFNAPSGGEASAYITMFVVAFILAPKYQQQPEPDSSSGEGLPFVRKNGNGANGADGSLHGNGVDFWDVQPAGSWGEDCAVGKEYARIYVNQIKQRTPRRPITCWIIRDMIRHGRYTGVEAGFIQHLGQASKPAWRFYFNDPSLIADHNPDDGGAHRSIG